MRKIFSISVSVLLVVLMAVPAFATGFSGSSDVAYNSIWQFDYIEFDGTGNYDDLTSTYPATYVVPWESVSLYGDTANFDYNQGGIYGYSQAADYDNYPAIGSALYVPALGSWAIVSTPTSLPMSFTIVGNNMIYQWNRNQENLFSLSYDYDVMRVENVVTTATYTVMVFDESLDSYVAETRTFNHTEAYYPSQVIDLSYQMRLLAEASGGRDEIVNVKHIEIRLTFRYVGDTDNPTFYLRQRAKASPNVGVDSWVRQYDLNAEADIVVEESSDIMAWLKASVNSFLEFEFFPGFSIDKLFVIVLTIGLMLWFITMLI